MRKRRAGSREIERSSGWTNGLLVMVVILILCALVPMLLVVGALYRVIFF